MRSKETIEKKLSRVRELIDIHVKNRDYGMAEHFKGWEHALKWVLKNLD